MFVKIIRIFTIKDAHGHHCGANERYLVVGPSIEPTCRVWRPHSRSTSETSGCFCMSGKVREEKTGCCVDMAQCRCGRNEYRNALGNCVLRPALRIGSKLGAVISTGRKCPIGYEPDVSGKCCVICPHGTTRNKYGKCVSVTQVKTCEEGEVYNECCPVIQPTCVQPIITASLDQSDCQAGCVCRAGLVRNGNGKCISIENCI